MTDSSNKSEPIIGMWKAAGGSAEFTGILRLGDRPSLRFPMLVAPDLVPHATTVFHGRSADMDKYTALTLPARGFGSRGKPGGEISYNLDLRVLAVLLGEEFVEEPEDLRVSEISFAPEPNEALHASSLYEYLRPDKDILSVQFAPDADESIKSFASAFTAYFAVERLAFIDVDLPSFGKVAAHLVGTRSSDGGTKAEIRFRLTFETPLSLRGAEQEAHVFCAFLSFISHGFITASNIGLRSVKGVHFGLVGPRYRNTAEPAPHSHPTYSLLLPDKHPEEFSRALVAWYDSNDALLRSRFLYRWSLSEPLTFSYERFLAVFNAVDGLLKAIRARNREAYIGKLLTSQELSKAIIAVRTAVSESDKLDLFLKAIKNANAVSPREAFLQEVSSLFKLIGASPEEGDVASFVQRVFNRRNRMAHGGRGITDELGDPLLTLDTMILTAIYVMLDAQIVGMDPLDAGMKFGSAYAWKPLKYDVPGADREGRLRGAWTDKPLVSDQ